MRVTIKGTNTTTATQPGASNKQLDFLLRLVSERQLDEEASRKLRARIEAQMDANAARGDSAAEPNGITKRRASEFIERLLAKPKMAASAARQPVTDEPWKVERVRDQGDNEIDAMVCANYAPGERKLMIVPLGKYAIETEGMTGTWANDLAFVNVWANEVGRWSVKMYASDELVPLPRKVQYEVLATIGAEGPAIASMRYGLHKTQCGVCGRKLTNDESRARGIGPVCADRMGW